MVGLIKNKIILLAFIRTQKMFDDLFCKINQKINIVMSYHSFIIEVKKPNPQFLRALSCCGF